MVSNFDNIKFLHPVGISTFKYGVSIPLEAQTKRMRAIQAPVTEKQAVYSKTLLGVKSAKAVEQWVTDNREFLLELDSNEDWLAMVWGLFSELSNDKFFHTVEPDSLGIQLATQWLQGNSYQMLFNHSHSTRRLPKLFRVCS